MNKLLLIVPLLIGSVGLSSLSFAASHSPSNTTTIDPSKNHVLIRAKAGNGPSQAKLIEQYRANGDYESAIYWAEQFTPYPDIDPKVLNTLGIVYLESIDFDKNQSLDEKTIQRYYDRGRQW